MTTLRQNKLRSVVQLKELDIALIPKISNKNLFLFLFHKLFLLMKIRTSQLSL